MASESVVLVAQLGGELITYTPAGGVAKSFKAVVERRPMQVESTGGFQYGANTIELLIPRDATDGVLTVREGKDRVRFKKSLDDAQETEFTVNKVLQEDAGLTASDGGMFRVEVRA
jgi:hypothetical protein